MFDTLLSSIELEIIANRIAMDIDEYCVKKFSEEHRNHLGASLIGHDCARHIWYAFRWAKLEMFDGRQLRLFNRGHLEEARFIEWLRGIGFQVWEVDPNTGQQFRIWGAKGHYGGGLDSGAIPPYPKFNEPILLEFKTHNRGSFAKLLKEKLVISKPRHYAQMCAYGKHYGFKYGLYLAVNKDDDDIYPEIVPLNPRDADDLTRKAEDIIFSPIAPPKIALEKTFFECKFCAFSGICHDNQPMEINCRSCRYAEPVDNAKWHCHFYKQQIPEEFIPKGCPSHIQIG